MVEACRSIEAVILELEGATLTYEVFRALCLETNKPCIIRNACCCGDNLWFNVPLLKTVLSPKELLGLLGSSAVVPVYPIHSSADLCSETVCTGIECEEGDSISQNLCCYEEVAGAGCSVDVALCDVFESWVETSFSSGAADNCNTFQGGAPENGIGRLAFLKSHIYYLKDWHFQAIIESQGDALLSSFQRGYDVHGLGLYTSPSFLGSDWMDRFCLYMQEYRRQSEEGEGMKCTAVPPQAASFGEAVGFGNGKSDYRFTYIGPVGTWTPLHCDVFGTYSWSFNVCGTKLWFFPTQEGNTFLQATLVPGFPTPPDVRVMAGLEYDTVTQRPGDLVFVPSGYYHQVHNVSGESFHIPPRSSTDKVTCDLESRGRHSIPLTVALNHNWCCAFNIDAITQTFLANARQLTSKLSVDDLSAIFGNDRSLWLAEVDQMLQSGANWSFASMTCFLKFCLTFVKATNSQVDIEIEDSTKTALLLEYLITLVQDFRDGLFR